MIELVIAGKTMRQIAVELGTTKNACISKYQRLLRDGRIPNAIAEVVRERQVVPPKRQVARRRRVKAIVQVVEETEDRVLPSPVVARDDTYEGRHFSPWRMSEVDLLVTSASRQGGLVFRSYVRHSVPDRHQCRFIEDDETYGWRWCRRQAKEESAYCEEHHERCYTKAAEAE